LYQPEQVTYPPLNTLKPVASEVWIVDGPEIRFGFPSRMTVIRLEDRHLFIHSPTLLTPALKREILGIGTPHWLIGPNRLHYWWIPEWREAYPEAAIYLAPRIRAQAGGRIDFPTQKLEGETGYSWDKDIATLAVPGSFMTEFAFFHRPSRTLVLTDLIENFEPRKLGLVMRFLTWIGGVQDPDGQCPATCASPLLGTARSYARQSKPCSPGTLSASSSPMGAGTRAAAPPSFAAPSDGSSAISEPWRMGQRSGAV
jgi:hypothetical protein